MTSPSAPAGAFTPSTLVNPTFLPTPSAALSPALLLSATSQLLEDSPQSAQEISEFDFLFAQENLERSGLQIGEGDPLPLFLDGHSLGSTQSATDPSSFLGLENFFLPADVDNRLAGGNVAPEATDLWW